jgi:MFS family permease
MNHDIGLSATAFGYGSGILFLGYCFFEVPSNVALYRFGARLWLARIMISWGIISMATMLVSGPRSFNLLRFLLGVAEAGFFPGAAYYLAQWFPTRFLSGIGAAGLALINSVGTMGGFVGPSVMGFLRDATGSFNAGLLALSGFLFVSTVLAFMLKLVISTE